MMKTIYFFHMAQTTNESAERVMIEFARAGGGGSSSRGSSSHSSSRSSSRSSYSSSGGSRSGGPIDYTFLIIFLIIFIFGVTGIVIKGLRMKKQLEKNQEIKKAQKENVKMLTKDDPTWDEKQIKSRVQDVFLRFQESWSKFDVRAFDDILTPTYRNRIILELGVLQAEQRQNLVETPVIRYINIISATQDEKKKINSFVAEVTAHAKDKLIEIDTGKILSKDPSQFTEYWEFHKIDNQWKLHIIRQETESAEHIQPEIQEFANKNNFFYDPDFGWLMLPNRGVLFGSSPFLATDINNHVIGAYRNSIVELYTYTPEKSLSIYTVAQAILPKKYNNILIKRSSFFSLKPKKLIKMSLESNDFNEKFSVWASPEDKINSLELLAPDFMAKIYDLPFEVNIEIVGPFLYFYTKKKGVQYETLFALIAEAFDAMKM